jgi:hypothetical protein
MKKQAALLKEAQDKHAATCSSPKLLAKKQNEWPPPSCTDGLLLMKVQTVL